VFVEWSTVFDCPSHWGVASLKNVVQFSSSSA
jgi:hypothetical protein